MFTHALPVLQAFNLQIRMPVDLLLSPQTSNFIWAKWLMKCVVIHKYPS